LDLKQCKTQSGTSIMVRQYRNWKHMYWRKGRTLYSLDLKSNFPSVMQLKASLNMQYDVTLVAQQKTRTENKMSNMRQCTYHEMRAVYSHLSL
jgi:hypothetical protein